MVLLAFAKYAFSVMKGGIEMLLDIIKSPTVKKVMGIVSVVIAGVVAVDNALSEQKKDKEFEDMKNAISELQKKQ